MRYICKYFGDINTSPIWKVEWKKTPSDIWYIMRFPSQIAFCFLLWKKNKINSHSGLCSTHPLCIGLSATPTKLLLNSVLIWNCLGQGKRNIKRVIRVFSWCVNSWYYFPWKVNLGNHSLWLVTWRFCMNREEPELF